MFIQNAMFDCFNQDHVVCGCVVGRAVAVGIYLESRVSGMCSVWLGKLSLADILLDGLGAQLIQRTIQFEVLSLSSHLVRHGIRSVSIHPSIHPCDQTYSNAHPWQPSLRKRAPARYDKTSDSVDWKSGKEGQVMAEWQITRTSTLHDDSQPLQYTRYTTTIHLVAVHFVSTISQYFFFYTCGHVTHASPNIWILFALVVHYWHVDLWKQGTHVD